MMGDMETDRTGHEDLSLAEQVRLAAAQHTRATQPEPTPTMWVRVEYADADDRNPRTVAATLHVPAADDLGACRAVLVLSDADPDDPNLRADQRDNLAAWKQRRPLVLRDAVIVCDPEAGERVWVLHEGGFHPETAGEAD